MWIELLIEEYTVQFFYFSDSVAKDRLTQVNGKPIHLHFHTGLKKLVSEVQSTFEESALMIGEKRVLL